MLRIIILFFAPIALFLFGCASVSAPPGIDRDVFTETKKESGNIKTSKNSVIKKNYVKGPDQKIMGDPYGQWALVEFENKSGEIAYRLLYQCHGISVGKAKEERTGTLLKPDLLMQQDVEGFVLESGAVDLERKLLDDPLDRGLIISLVSKGEGTVFTGSPEMIEALINEDWEAVDRMTKNGGGQDSKYLDRKSVV